MSYDFRASLETKVFWAKYNWYLYSVYSECIGWKPTLMKPTLMKLVWTWLVFVVDLYIFQMGKMWLWLK